MADNFENKQLGAVTISVVSPVYKGAGMVDELVRRIKAGAAAITEDYEIILVNDASPDSSWEEIKKQCALDKRVIGIDLSRNFGQHYAITAGLRYTRGKWTVILDCDLQDRPEAIPELYKKAQEGYDIVQAARVNRQSGFLKSFTANIYNKIFNWMVDNKQGGSSAHFGIYKRTVIDVFNSINEYARAVGSLMRHLGFRKTVLEVEHAKRLEGTSSYSVRKLFKLAFDVIISHSNKPLRMTIWLGFFMFSISLILAFYNLLAKVFNFINVPGYSSTVFSIWFVGGILLFELGILGLYIGKIFDQVKGRPLFAVREEINTSNKNNQYPPAV